MMFDLREKRDLSAKQENDFSHAVGQVHAHAYLLQHGDDAISGDAQNVAFSRCRYNGLLLSAEGGV